MATPLELVFPEREVETIKLLAEGLSFTAIGKRMGVSPRTARAYAESARKKLRVKFAKELPKAYYEATGDDPWPS